MADPDSLGGHRLDRECSVQLTSPLYQVEKQLLNLKASNFLQRTKSSQTGGINRRRPGPICSVCSTRFDCQRNNDPIQSTDWTGSAEDRQHTIEAFKSLCLALDLSPFANLAQMQAGAVVFRCCPSCADHLQDLEQMHTEMRRAIERFDTFRAHVMGIIVGSYLNKIFNPAPSLLGYLREQQPLILERWKTKLYGQNAWPQNHLNKSSQSEDDSGRVIDRQRTPNAQNLEKRNRQEYVETTEIDRVQDMKVDVNTLSADMEIQQEVDEIKIETLEAEPTELNFDSSETGGIDEQLWLSWNVTDHPNSPNLRATKKSKFRKPAFKTDGHEQTKRHWSRAGDPNVLVYNNKVMKKRTLGGVSVFVCDVNSCGKTFAVKHAFKRHLEYHLEKTIPCSTCGKLKASDYLLQRHIKIAHEASKCRFCHESVSGGPISLRKHEFDRHKNAYLTERPFYCTICLETFKTQVQLDSHAVQHDTSKCKICGHISQSLRGLKVHERRHYINPRKDFADLANETLRVRCLLCDMESDKEELVKLHYRVNHAHVVSTFRFAGIKQGDCDSSKGAEQKRKHLLALTKRYTCEICGASYSHAPSLRNHRQRRHLGITTSTSTVKTFICEICGKTLHNSSMRSYHMRAHRLKEQGLRTGTTKKTNCTHCGKAFCLGRSYRLHLVKEHRQEYLRENPHLCEVCMRAFPSQELLNTHFGSHHKCKFCGKMFDEKSKFVEHERIHTKEQPLTCDVCGKKFSGDSNLRMHKRIHTGERSIWCNLCPGKVGFFRKRELEKHMEKFHPT